MRIKLLIIITILGALLRFTDLGKIPQSLNWDEIAIGYNAYSILKTGKDEYGNTFPLAFRSFEDYKSPLYIYLTIPSILIFGKSEFAIRFPSALLGTLTIPAIYYLTSILIKPKNLDQDNKFKWENRLKNIAIISAFLLSITPWHIHFSRVAYEANIGLFLFVVATILFGKWLNNKKLSFLILTTIIFVLAIYSYANMRLLVPLFIISFLIPYFNHLKKYNIQTIFATSLATLLLIPIGLQIWQGVGLARFQATSVANREEVYTQQKTRFSQEIQSNNTLFAQILYNYRIPMSTEILNSYLSHFKFDFLFLENAPSRFKMAGTGLLHLWYFPIILIGIIAFTRWSKELTIPQLFSWLIIAPIPAALTWDTPHPIRSQMMVIPLIIFASIGLWVILKNLQRIDINNYNNYSLLTWLVPKVGLITISCIILFTISHTWLTYNTNMNIEFAESWLYGRKEMVKEVNELNPQFQTVKVSLSLDWAYLWFLWYSDIDPQKYLESGGTKGGNFDFSENQIDKIQFKNFDYTKESQNSTGTLYVGTPKDFPPQFVPTNVIENSEGQKFIYIVRS